MYHIFSSAPFRAARKGLSAVSILALFLFAAGGAPLGLSIPIAYANNGIAVSVTPNTGTLSAGDALTVDMTVSLDPNDTNPITSPSCLINGVDVANTFTNLTSGTDGHFRFTYNVGESDTDRAAGQVPIDCTLHQTGTVTITGFDDGNTVAIDAVPDSTGGDEGGDTGGTGDDTGGTVTPGADGIATYSVPGSGTLTPGQSMEVHMEVALDANDTNPVTSPSCLVNGVDVANTFTNLTSGTDGHFKFTYTVGESDTDRAAGQVPINCTLAQTGSVTVTSFDQSDVAIDAGTDGTGTTTPPGGEVGGGSTPTLAGFSVSPSTGSIHAGDTATITIVETNGLTDLSVAGSCKVNVRDVGSTLQSLGNGSYTLTYTVDPSDGERPAGILPIDCTLGNDDGTFLVHHPWTDGNTLAVDTNGDGTIDNGENMLGFTVMANPSSGTLHDGDSMQVSMQDPLPSGDVVIGSEGCLVNGVNVAGSYAYQGNGLYTVSYTVGASDTPRAAGETPIACTLQNSTGSVHLHTFTDNNTVAIEPTGSSTPSGGDEGGTGTTTPPTNGSWFGTVNAVPETGTLGVGQNLEIHFYTDPQQNDLTLNGACTVNGVDVSGSFANLTDGQYRTIYTVGASDTARAAGTVPVLCNFQNGSGATTTVSAFTVANSVAIDPTIGGDNGGNTGGDNGGNDNGTTTPPGDDNGTTTPSASYSINQVSANPNFGALDVGDLLEVYMHENSGADNMTLAGACTVNNVDVSGTFTNLTSGFYKVSYTVDTNDSNRAAGQIPVNCIVGKDGSNATASAFTDGNSTSIDIAPTGGDNGGNDNGTTTPPGGDNTGDNTGGDNGGTTGGNTGGESQISSTTPITLAVTAQPGSGTLHQGAHLFVQFQESHQMNDLSLGGACTVNNVSVGPLENMGGGFYRVDYTIGTSDADRSAGTIPVSCLIQNGSGTTTQVSAFTDGNTTAIDVMDDGTATTTPEDNGTTTPSTSTPAVLAIDSINQTRDTATSTDSFSAGWAWTFNITVPDDQPVLHVKFGDWTKAGDASTTIQMENNMRVWSDQAATTTPFTLTAAGVYSDPMTITGDLDPSTPGKQIALQVEMQIPEGSADGSYGTYYGIQTSEDETVSETPDGTWTYSDGSIIGTFAMTDENAGGSNGSNNGQESSDGSMVTSTEDRGGRSLGGHRHAVGGGSGGVSSTGGTGGITLVSDTSGGSDLGVGGGYDPELEAYLQGLNGGAGTGVANGSASADGAVSPSDAVAFNNNGVFTVPTVADTDSGKAGALAAVGSILTLGTGKAWVAVATTVALVGLIGYGLTSAFAYRRSEDMW